LRQHADADDLAHVDQLADPDRGDGLEGSFLAEAPLTESLPCG
jgi:hypothetical protein